MKITITQLRELAGGRIVRPGDVLESPKDGSDELLAAYVQNGIAVDVTSPASRIPNPEKGVKENVD